MPIVMKRGLTADESIIVFSVAGPASYVVGGFDPGFPTMGRPMSLLGGGSQADGKTTGYLCSLDITNKLVKVMRGGAASSPLAEETGGVNLSTFTFNITVLWGP